MAETKAQCTPERWVFDPENVGRDMNIGYGIHSESSGWTVAHVPMSHGGGIGPSIENPNAEADARLIAAAPQLVRALKAIFPLPCLQADDLGNTCGINWTCGNCQRNIVAEAALEKAGVKL